jgi:2-dehydropantoate 2-reductase
LGNQTFAILGAGAMGSILAAHLARAGNPVTLLARGARAQQIESDGVRITGLSEFSQHVTVARDPATVHGEVLIVALKGADMRTLLHTIPSAQIRIALSVQNGLEKNDVLKDIFGADRTLGALANISGELFADGKVAFTRNANIYIGEMDGATSERSAQLAKVIDDAGVRTQSSNHVLSLEWSKFAAWAGMMVLSVATRVETCKFLRDPSAARLIAQLAAELGRIASALGIYLTDESVLPVATLCASSESDAIELVQQLGRQIEHSAPQHRMSALQDLNSGRALEIEPTLGYAYKQAVSLGIEVPILSTCLSLTRAIDRIRASER